MKKTGHVISATHWDREWYHSMERYRFRLARCMDRVLALLQNDPAWRCYHTDGQMQMLLDYLDIRPGARDTIKALNRAGKLKIGPWLVQPDEQILHGEVAVRNIEAGLEEAKKLGGAEKFGYLADNFGHVGQMPQILRNFGMDAAAFWRGYDENYVSALENRWIGVDGSEILAFLMPRSYTTGANYGPREEDDHKLERHLPKLLELSRTGNLVLNDGIDHSLPPLHLAEVLAEMSDRLGLDEIRQSSWTEVIEAVRNAKIELPVLRGEMLLTPGLDGTFSTRLHQKQLSFRAELALLSYAEPLAALAARRDGVDRYGEFLRRAWRHILKNAAHDSIGGAHSDAVEHDVDHRYIRVLQIAEGVVNEALNDLAGCRSDYVHAASPEAILVYNPLPRRVERGLEIEFVTPNRTLLERFDPIFKTVRLFAGDNEIPFATEMVRPGFETRFFDRLNPDIKHAFTWRIFTAPVELPAGGVTTLRLEYYASKNRVSIINADSLAEKKNAAVLAEKRPIAGADGRLENDFVRVQVRPDGRFDLCDKRTGECFTNLNALRDSVDNGTQYSFEAPPGGAERHCAAGSLGVADNSAWRGSVEVHTHIELFDELPGEPDFLVRRLGGNKNVRNTPITLRFTLESSSPALQIAVELDHRASGHRLRTYFPMPEGECRIFAGTVFDLAERRASDNPDIPCGSPAAMRHARPSAGFQRILGVGGLKNGLLIAARGLYEYRANYAQKELEMTLLRANTTVNFDFDAYGSALGGLEHGVRRIEYVLMPFSGGRPDEAALQALEEYLAPPLCRAFPGDALACSAEGIGLSGEGMVLDSFRRMPDNTEQLRFHYQGDAPSRAKIAFGAPVRRIRKIRMDGEVLAELGENIESVELPVRPREIVTLSWLTGCKIHR